MNISLGKNKPTSVMGRRLSARVTSRSNVILSALLVLATSVALAPAARADSYNFSFSGGGLSGSGVLTYSNTPVPNVPGAYQVTGISGTFSDSNLHLSNAMITGLQTTSLPSVNADGTFVPPGTFAISNPVGDPGLSYDNLFYPAGNSPLVCPPDVLNGPPGYPYKDGVLDIYGLLFNVNGGYTVDLWSNGTITPGPGLTYGATDSLDGARLTSARVSLNTSPVPEPSSLMLMGTGLIGLVSTLRRKLAA